MSTSYDKSVRVWEWHEEAIEDGVSQPGSDLSSRKSKGLGRLVREFRNLHASHIFDVKFDVGKIVRSVLRTFQNGAACGSEADRDLFLVSTSHDQKIMVLDFSYGIEGAELFA